MNQVATSGANTPGASLPALSPMSLALPRSRAAWAATAGVVAGAVYALSPLTVIVGLLCIPLCWWAIRDLSAFERRAVLAMLATAMALRVAAVIWLLLTANPNASSFATFFGDEEFFQLRGSWLYNVWMGIPISQEAFLYAYNGIGYSGYEQFLVFIQILVGPTPYGIHLLNSLIFVAGSTLLYKVVRRSYGPAPALAGFAVILFLPSLFSWSVSALKESLFMGLTIAVVLAALQVARARSILLKLLAAALIVAGMWTIESVRPGGLMLTVAGIAVGYAARLVTLRRWAQIGLVAATLVAVVSVSRSGMPPRIDAMLNQFAKYHRGHVFTPGHSYKLMDQVFYSDFFGSHVRPTMRPEEMTRYIVRAAVNYVAQPVPWAVESKVEVLFMPEQFVWYLLAALFPIGVVFAFRRDALLTCLLAGYTVTNAAVLALNSGNIGTLVRHRALVVPFLVWISAVGCIELLSRKGSH